MQVVVVAIRNEEPAFVVRERNAFRSVPGLGVVNGFLAPCLPETHGAGLTVRNVRACAVRGENDHMRAAHPGRQLVDDLALFQIDRENMLGLFVRQIEPHPVRMQGHPVRMLKSRGLETVNLFALCEVDDRDGVATRVGSDCVAAVARDDDFVRVPADGKQRV